MRDSSTTARYGVSLLSTRDRDNSSEGSLRLAAEFSFAQKQVLDLSLLIDPVALLPVNTAQIDTVQDQSESGSIYFDAGRGDVAEIGEPEGAFLQGFIPDGETVSVEVEELDLVGSLVSEYKK